MSIYELRPNCEVFDGLQPVHEEDWDRVKLWGKPIADAWVPVPVKLDPVPRKSRRQAHGDYPSLAGPVLTERALTILRPLIEHCVEILPLAYPDEPLFALNVTCVLDCLDSERSVYHRYSDGSPGPIERYIFKPGSIAGHDIFKLRHYEPMHPFVSEAFKRLVDDAGLLGFHFFAVEPDGSLREIPIRLPPGARPRSPRRRAR